MELYVLDETFEKIDVVENYKSLIWTKRFIEAGDFELYIPASEWAVQTLKTGRWLTRDEDTKSWGYSSLMQITGVTMSTDDDDVDYLIITGQDLKSVLKKRIIWGQMRLAGTPHRIVSGLIYAQAVNPSNAKRAIPHLKITYAQGLDAAENAVYKIQCTGQSLYDRTVSLCNRWGLGLDAFYKNGDIVLQLYRGRDKTGSVLFGPVMDNLAEAHYITDISGYKNLALVAGEGQGNARRTLTIGADDAEGMERNELWVDARDLSSDEGDISGAKYTKLLRDRGLEKLAECESIKRYDGFNVDGNDGNYKYQAEWDIGDVVKIYDAYGHDLKTRVTSVAVTWDDTGEYIDPGFDEAVTIGETGETEDYDTATADEETIEGQTREEIGTLDYADDSGSGTGADYDWTTPETDYVTGSGLTYQTTDPASYDYTDGAWYDGSGTDVTDNMGYGKNNGITPEGGGGTPVKHMKFMWIKCNASFWGGTEIYPKGIELDPDVAALFVVYNDGTADGQGIWVTPDAAQVKILALNQRNRERAGNIAAFAMFYYDYD